MCPGDLVFGLSQTNNKLDTCRSIRQKHLADGTSCPWIDKVYNCGCGGLNHAFGHHETFEQQMEDEGIIGHWAPVIFQKSIDPQSGKRICMASEKNRGGCILPEHENEYPAPEHISWMDVERRVVNDQLSEGGSLRRIYEECFKHCLEMKQGIIDFEDFVLAYTSVASGPIGEFDRSEEIAEEEREKKVPIKHMALKTIPPRSGQARRRQSTPAPGSRSKDGETDASSSSLRGPELEAMVARYATEEVVADEGDPTKWSGRIGWVRVVYVRNKYRLGPRVSGSFFAPDGGCI